MQTNYVGPTEECVFCQRSIPEKNTLKIPIGEGRTGKSCEVCLILRGEGEAT